MKRIMSGREFANILCYLHVCPMEMPTDDEYDPSYKVKELMEMLETQFNLLFVPGKNLSLDKSLIQTFGHIKFKVRIVTKAA